jgi:hypothetical protein
MQFGSRNHENLGNQKGSSTFFLHSIIKLDQMSLSHLKKSFIQIALVIFKYFHLTESVIYNQFSELIVIQIGNNSLI